MFRDNHNLIKMIRVDHGQNMVDHCEQKFYKVDHGQPWLTMVHLFLQWPTMVNHGPDNDFIMIFDG